MTWPTPLRRKKRVKRRHGVIHGLRRNYINGEQIIQYSKEYFDLYW
jgi:hypothetical protein